jgi:hypothetical protein
MTNRDLATGVFRAWGVIWWIYVFINLPQFVNEILRNPYRWSEQGTAQFFFSSRAISLGCEVAVALFLVTRAAWLASIVFPREQEFSPTVSAEDFRALLFASVGLYFVLDGARHIVGAVYLLIVRPRGSGANAADYLWRNAPETLAIGLGGTLAGAYVLFGRGALRNPANGLRAVYERLFGLKEPPDPS